MFSTSKVEVRGLVVIVRIMLIYVNLRFLKIVISTCL
jgi:hypothetical protein